MRRSPIPSMQGADGRPRQRAAARLDRRFQPSWSPTETEKWAKVVKFAGLKAD